MQVRMLSVNSWLAAVIAASSVVVMAVAGAQVPMAKEESPGWYRMRLGTFEITALTDGTLSLPVDKIFANPEPDRIRALLAQSYLSNDVSITVNAFLVNTGKHLVLIDTGTGTSAMFGPRLGKLLANLQASGYSAEQVQEIYVTHMHTDHIGGLLRDGKPAFPNATIRADAREAALYLSQAKMDAAPADEKEDFESALTIFKPYQAAMKFKPFDGATELVPGVRAMPAPGHTPGHTIYVAESQGQRMLFWGDLMHVAALQFPVPAATVSFEWNKALSAQQRQSVFADVAKSGSYAAAAHVAFPGIGKLRATGDGYAWVPVGYIFGR